jgi:hypothetical protein
MWTRREQGSWRVAPRALMKEKVLGPPAGEDRGPDTSDRCVRCRRTFGGHDQGHCLFMSHEDQAWENVEEKVQLIGFALGILTSALLGLPEPIAFMAAMLLAGWLVAWVMNSRGRD